MSSTLMPHHLALIMDGNGRWAVARGQPRSAGHKAGAATVRRIVAAAAERDIRVLSLYAFSADNWQRPREEVAGLLGLFSDYLRAVAQELVEHDIRLRVIGRRDRLPLSLRGAISAAEHATENGRRLRLQLAIDYSARDAIVAAAALASGRLEAKTSRAAFAATLGHVTSAGGPSSSVDLVIRTGGEQRLSDFLLWECAYAELIFCPSLWPDFTIAELDAALEEYGRRQRRFGRVGAQAS